MRIIRIFLGVLFLFVISCDLEDIVVTVSGKVTDDGEPVSGAFVLLLESEDISEGLSLSNGMITDNSGRYTILDVDEGKYYVVAIDDVNGNLQFDAETDQLGFYGVDPSENDYEANRITVSDEDVKNYEVEVYFDDIKSLKLKAQNLKPSIDSLKNNRIFKGLYALGKYYSLKHYPTIHRSDYFSQKIIELKLQ